jgi:hypothetical protein
MNTMLRMAIGFAISALLPVSALAHDVMYDYDHTQDFSRLKTYALKDFTKSDNPLVDARIESAIAAELAARGLTRDDTDPDVYVTARQAFDTHQEYRTYDSGYGIPYGPYGGWGWSGNWGYYGYLGGLGGYTDVVVKNITMRTLTIDLTDPATDKVMWRGAGTRRVHSTSKPERVTKRTNDEVEDIFDNFPPKRR